MGLLDNIGNKLSSMSDDDKRGMALGLASGFAGMSGNPNTASIMAGIEGQQAALAARREKTAASDRLAAQTEQALRLISTTYPDIAQAIQGGFMSPKEGMAEVMARRNAPEDKGTSAMQEYYLAVDQGFEGSILDFKQAVASSGASKFDIDNSKGSEVGTIPQGWELFTTPSGGRSMRPIAGGPEALAAKAAVEKKQMALETTARTGGIVLEDIGRFKSLIKNQDSLDPVTGWSGSIASMVPASARVDAEQLASTIKGNVGFDRLQQMRNESPTGGALGAINKQEMDLLSSVLGSLDLSQSETQLLQNLDRLETVYMNIMVKAQAYPNASKYGLASSESSSGSESIPTWNPTGGPDGKGAFE